MSENVFDFGTCKVCGGETYNVNGGSYLCKNVNCQAWYKPQEAFIYIKLPDGEEGFLRKDHIEKMHDKLPEGTFIDEYSKN